MWPSSMLDGGLQYSVISRSTVPSIKHNRILSSLNRIERFPTRCSWVYFEYMFFLCLYLRVFALASGSFFSGLFALWIIYFLQFLHCCRCRCRNETKKMQWKAKEKPENVATVALDATYAINGKAARENTPGQKRNTKYAKSVCSY